MQDESEVSALLMNDSKENSNTTYGATTPAVTVIKKENVLNATDLCESMFNKRSKLKDNMLALSLKAGFAAFFWEIFSNLYTVTPDDIPTLSAEFAKYSFLITGAAAGVGINIGLLVYLLSAKCILDTGGAVVSTKSKSAKKNLIQAAQLFVATFLTDSFWAISNRIFIWSIQKHPALGIMGSAPLLLMGPWFILVGKGVHQLSRTCVKDKNSFNPQWKDRKLLVGVSLGEFGFAVATLFSLYLNLLNGRIKNDFVAGLADALLCGSITGLFAATPYLFELGLSYLGWPQAVYYPSKVFAVPTDRTLAQTADAGSDQPHKTLALPANVDGHQSYDGAYVVLDTETDTAVVTEAVTTSGM